VHVAALVQVVPLVHVAALVQVVPLVHVAALVQAVPLVHVAAQLSAPVHGLLLTFMRLDESSSWSSSMAWRRPGAVLESPCRGGSGRGRSASPLLRLPNGPFRMGEIQYYIQQIARPKFPKVKKFN
jgi:hypothetical protein